MAGSDYAKDATGAALDYLKGAAAKPVAAARATPGLDLRAAAAALTGNSLPARAAQVNFPGLALGGGGPGAAPAAVPPAEPGAASMQNPYDATFGTVQPGSMGGGGMQLSPPRLIGAHFDDSRVPLRPNTQNQLFGALDNTRTLDAHHDLATVQANAAMASANILESEAERASVARAERMEREKERQTFVRQQLDTAKRLNEDAQKATVDPSRFWKSPGAVLMSIGAVLSTNGEGTHALERAQEMDLASQREENALRRQRGEDVINTLGKYEKAFGDERAAELAFEADSRDVARMKLMALAERSQSPQIMAQAQLVASGLAESRDAKVADLRARLDQMAYVPAQVVGGGATGSGKPLENVVNLPNGMSLQMPSKELQTDAIKRIAVTEQIKRNNEKAVALREQARKDPKQWGTIKQQLADLREDTMAMVSVAREQGVVKDAEFERAKSSTAAYLELTPGTDETIRQHTNRTVENLGFFLRASGAEQVQRGYAQDQRGAIQPRGAYVGNNVKPPAVEAPGSFQLQQPQVGKR
jgi:hypothetical protein